MVWATGLRGDTGAVGHAMPEDSHGRPDDPLCGRSSHGLFLRAWTAWEAVPEAQRCLSCADALRATGP